MFAVTEFGVEDELDDDDTVAVDEIDVDDNGLELEPVDIVFWFELDAEYVAFLADCCDGGTWLW